MELSRNLQKAFSVPDIADAPNRYPRMVLAVIKDLTGDRGRYRSVLSDGQYMITSLFENMTSIDVSAGDIIEVTKYSLHYFSKLPKEDGKSGEKPKEDKPAMRVYQFKKVGTVDVASAVGEKLSASIINALKGDGAGATAPATAAVPAAASRPAASDAAPPKASKGRRHELIHPIEGVTPYLQAWKIRARASQKGALREYKSDRGEGKLFNVTFVDETGEIRCTGFNNEAERFYDLLRDGQLYYISKCKVQPANKKFSNVQNDFELVLSSDTIIEPCSEEVDVPEAIHKFVAFDQLESVPKDANVDVIGVAKDVQEVSKITSKSTGRPYDKREIVLVDQSGTSVRTTLWGQEANDFSAKVDDVISIKGAKVGEFSNNKTLSTLRSSLLTINPNIREAHALKGWYDADGHAQSFNPAHAEGGEQDQKGKGKQEIKFIKQVLEERLGHSEVPDYFTVRATVIQVFTRGLTYPACTTEGCNKKVIQETNGDWRCEKCGSVMSEPSHRYIMSLVLGDGMNSEGLRVSAFDEVGKLIMGCDASETAEVVASEDDDRLKQLLNQATGKEFFFRCKTRLETYSGESRVRYQLLSATPVKQTLPQTTWNIIEDIEA